MSLMPIPRPRTPLRLPGGLLAALALAVLVPPLLLAGCGGGETPESASPEAASPEAAATADDGVREYEVRGEITALPDPEDPLSNLVIRHEAIDDFESFEGEVVGMSSMSMPFPVAEDLSMEGIEVGDKVEFTLLVDWDAEPAYQVTRMEELPAETELEYRKAQPPEGAAEEALEATGLDEEEAEAGGSPGSP